MKENETLLMLDGVNQQIGERSHSAVPQESHRAASAGGKKTFEMH